MTVDIGAVACGGARCSHKEWNLPPTSKTFSTFLLQKNPMFLDETHESEHRMSSNSILPYKLGFPLLGIKNYLYQANSLLPTARSLDSKYHRVILQRKKTNEVSPVFAHNFCLKTFCRLLHKRRLEVKHRYLAKLKTRNWCSGG